jgi:hypothetical protein
VVLATIEGPGIADGTNLESCGEDRFFGVFAPVGVKTIAMTSTKGGIEADHLQYGRLH